jgi:hypothetical protein
MLRVFWDGRRTRILLALPLAIFASSLAAASDNPMAPRAAGEPPARASGQPRVLSKFDYLVLASMADSKQLFTMAGYQGSGSAHPSTAVDASGHPINRGNLQCHL